MNPQSTSLSCNATSPPRGRPPRTRLPPLELALCIATALAMTACGGGGGGGMGGTNVRDTAPAPTVVRLVSGQTQTIANETRREALALEGAGTLILSGFNSFAGGTTVNGGTLKVDGRFTSDISVAPGANLELIGRVIGNVVIDGTFEPIREEETVEYGYYYTYTDTNITIAEIDGSYRQSASATMRAMLGEPDDYDEALLTVDDVATLAGTLELDTNYFTNDAYTAWLIHANGGVSGQFARWTSPGLFIQGSLRYAPNDVYFDVVRASILQAMSDQGFADPIALASAANLDQAFAFADAFALSPRADLGIAQRRFLRSAAAIQRIDDYAQAAATLDSLSGQAHADAPWRLLANAAQPAPQLSARLDRLQQGARAGTWAARPRTGGQWIDAGSMGVGYSVDGQVSGFDQWLGERVLLGGSVGWRNTRMQFDHAGGHSRDASRQASVYLHYRGDAGLYARGQVGVDRSRLTLDRQIDLDRGGRHHAHSQRDLDFSHAYVEAGRAFAAGRGRLVPYAALGYASVRSDGVVEQGDTGFELALQPWRGDRISAGTGVRYARQWAFGDGSWIRLDLDARHERLLGSSDNPLLAAFVGTPLAQFNIAGEAGGTSSGWLGVGLDGGGRHGWAWFLDYGRGFAGPQRGDGWSLGMKLDF